MPQDRITYESKAETYSLDPAKVCEVVADMNKYIHFAVSRAQEDNPNSLKPSSGLIGNRRTLVLHTESVNQPGFLTSFDLAELVLAEDNSRLTLTVNAHPKVTIPSDDLHYVASQYVLKD